MKTKKNSKEHRAKIAQTREENNVDLFKIAGYQVSRNSMNVMTRSSNGKLLYYRDVCHALESIFKDVSEKAMADSKTVEKALEAFEKAEKGFLKALSSTLANYKQL